MSNELDFSSAGTDAALWLGIWIKERRLQRSWSQEGLCKGVCAVSYLSKIEQGRVSPSAEILHALAVRLDEKWDDSPETLFRLQALVESLYEAALTYDTNAVLALRPRLKEESAHLASGPFLLDGELLALWCASYDTLNEKKQADARARASSLLSRYGSVMDTRQHTLALLAAGRNEEALRYHPCALTYYLAGAAHYTEGRYTRAVEYLTESSRLAAEEGSVFLLTYAKMVMANCYSNLHDYTHMALYTKAARRLAAALGQMDMLYDLDYNQQSTNIEIGKLDEAYAFFSALSDPNAMSLHKLAVCCEKLGKKEEALSALDRAAAAPVGALGRELVDEICAPVRFRLLRPDYLKRPEYGEMLLSVFEKMRRTLPIGYAGFHLPWMLEWYTANRLYREAYRLMLDFPGKI